MNEFIKQQAERDFLREQQNLNPFPIDNPNHQDYEQAWEHEADKYLIDFHNEQEGPEHGHSKTI